MNDVCWEQRISRDPVLNNSRPVAMCRPGGYLGVDHLENFDAGDRQRVTCEQGFEAGNAQTSGTCFA